MSELCETEREREKRVCVLCEREREGERKRECEYKFQNFFERTRESECCVCEREKV